MLTVNEFQTGPPNNSEISVNFFYDLVYPANLKYNEVYPSINEIFTAVG